MPEDLDPHHLAKSLRQLPEVERFDQVWRMMSDQPDLALQVTPRVQLRPVLLEVLLEHWLVYSNAGSVERALRATAEGLGPKKMVRLIEGHMEDAPLVVHKALYYMPGLFPADESYQADVKRLAAEFEERHPDFRSVKSTGIHATQRPFSDQ